jgi:hypothetical protein
MKAAKESGVRIGIGSDWSPSGSKNLLGELKIARLYSTANGNLFADRELLQMATRTAAEILQWEKVLGSLEPGKYADLLVVATDSDDPYAELVQALERDIKLVIINGVPRFGATDLMVHFGPGTETWQLGQEARSLNLADEPVDPAIGTLTLRDASDHLREGLQQLPQLARDLEGLVMRPLREAQAPQWFLRLDEPDLEGITLRPFLDQGVTGLEAVRDQLRAAASVPLSQVLVPLDLDPLSVADDTTFFDRLLKQSNLPGYIKQGLPALY